MKVSYLGGPKDGDETHVDPMNGDVESEIVAVPTNDGGFITKRYNLKHMTRQYIWEDLTLGKS